MALFEILNAPGYSEADRTAEAAKLVGAHDVQRGLAALTQRGASTQPGVPIYAQGYVPVDTTHYTTTSTFAGLSSLNHRR